MNLTLIDLFSGCGGLSSGFVSRGFKVLAAVDIEQGKPVNGVGSLECNVTYEANIGVKPLARDLAVLTPAELLDHVHATVGIRLRPGDLTVLAACAPCTDFSRAKPANHGEHGRISAKNSL